MKRLECLGLRLDGEHLAVLDQSQLPEREIWLEADDPEMMREHIRLLRVRGAPLIGVAAALCLARVAERTADVGQLKSAAERLRSARPTAVNLAWAVDRVMSGIGPGFDPAAVGARAIAIFDEDVASCEAMARLGASLVRSGEGVLTHCNSGALATVGAGTALGAIIRAHELGRGIHVYVDETRPLLQGARLTAWELARKGVPYTLITDGMAAAVMRDGRVQRVMVGADRVASNGDFANKVGTYGLAVSAEHHGIPFHPVAPWSTVDIGCASGKSIPIEERDGDEVRGARGAFGAVRWSPPGAAVWNPSFDVTPATLVTSLVLDRGIVSREQLLAGGIAGLSRI